jgi:hypothetical protein
VRRRAWTAVVAVGVVAFAVYAASPVILSFDSRLVLYESTAIVEHQSLDLTDYEPIVRGWPLHERDGHAFSRYPYGTALLVTPLVGAIMLGGEIVGYDWPGEIRERAPRDVEKGIASLIAALAAAGMTLLTWQLTRRVVPAVVTGLLFAFATSAWSEASRALWQHGPVVLMTVLGLICLVKARGDPRWAALAGLPLGFAYVVRTSAVIPLVLVAVLVLVSYRRQLPLFVLAVLATVLPSIVYNLATFGSPFIPLYGTSSALLGDGLQSTFWNALAANVVSPARGLLVFSPLVIFAGVGVWLSRRQLDGLHAVAIATVLLHLVLVSNLRIWWAGHSYGPRFLIDVLPFLFFLMVPVVDRITRRAMTPAMTALACVFGLTVAWSVFVHAKGALDHGPHAWNAEPSDVDEHPDRVWDWGDFPPLRS